MEIAFSNSEVFLKQMLPRHLHIFDVLCSLKFKFLLGLKVLNLKFTFIKPAEIL